MQTYKYASVLTIAGSDSGGGAGIQADLKTISALGCYGTSAITAITAQNTLGVWGVHPIPPEIIAAQITAVMDDIRPSAIKIGMIPNEESIAAIARTLERYDTVPVIVDPVMETSSGTELFSPSMIPSLLEQLFPLATLVTPNIPEAVTMTGKPIIGLKDMRTAASRLLDHGSRAVLIKGGHLPGDHVISYYADQKGNGFKMWNPRILSRNTHGTGCTLSSAIAAHLAKGRPLEESVRLSEQFVRIAIDEGRCVRTGNGAGPLNHFFKPKKLTKFFVKSL